MRSGRAGRGSWLRGIPDRRRYIDLQRLFLPHLNRQLRTWPELEKLLGKTVLERRSLKLPTACVVKLAANVMEMKTETRSDFDGSHPSARSNVTSEWKKLARQMDLRVRLRRRRHRIFDVQRSWKGQRETKAAKRALSGRKRRMLTGGRRKKDGCRLDPCRVSILTSTARIVLRLTLRSRSLERGQRRKGS